MKKICFTAIIGEYDYPNPAPLAEGWECIAFTDTNTTAKALKEQGWKVRRVRPEEDSVRLARSIKTAPHLFMRLSVGDITVWIDGSITLSVTLDDLVSRLSPGSSMLTFKHPQRNCVYAEADACIRLKKDDPDVIRRQASIYSRRGFPRNSGLVETGMMLRIHNKQVDLFGQKWRDEIYRHSQRDQIAFPWIMFHHPIPYNTISKDGIYSIQKHIVLS